MVLLLAFTSFPKQEASANGLFVRVAGSTVGERIIASMAEKAGIHYMTKSARKKAVQAWNAKVLREIDKAEIAGDVAKADELRAFQQMIQSKTVQDVTPLAKKQGYGKIAIKTAKFLLGVDIFEDIFDEMEDAAQAKMFYEFMMFAADAVNSGQAITSWKGFRTFVGYSDSNYGKYPSLYLYPCFNPQTLSGMRQQYLDDRKPFHITMSNFSDDGTYFQFTMTKNLWYYDAIFKYFSPDIYPSELAQSIQTYQGNWGEITQNCGYAEPDWAMTISVPQQSDLATRIPSPTMDNRDNLPEDIELVIPMDDDYPEEITEPWNDVVEEETPPPSEPTDKPAGSSWWEWLLSPLIKLIELMKSAIDGLVDIVKGLAKAIADAIGAIFVPSDEYFDGYFKEIKTTWDTKIPIIGQLSDFMTTVKDSSTGGNVPVIEVDLPERYGGVKISVIDFSYFEQYRVWILNFIRFTAWFFFLKKLFARLPKVIGG